jgi:hypothetical protein
LRHRREREYGRYEGRKRLPAISQQFGGEFAMWVRAAWSEVVGTQGHVQFHHARGADVAVMFWSYEAATKADRTVVAEYLAREAGKWQQKKPPPGFAKVGRFYGLWGRSVGFYPHATVTPLEPPVALEVGARLQRWVNWKLHVLRKGAPPSTGLAVRRSGDGVTAFGLGPAQAERLLRWSEEAAARKRATNGHRGDGAAGPVALGGLLVDLQTGEVRSIEETGSSVQDVGVHGLEVATHGRSRVAVAEDPLNVEQVELVPPIRTARWRIPAAVRRRSCGATWPSPATLARPLTKVNTVRRCARSPHASRCAPPWRAAPSTSRQISGDDGVGAG